MTTSCAFRLFCTSCNLASALIKATSVLLIKQSNGHFLIFVLVYISGAFGSADYVYHSRPTLPAKVIFSVRLIPFCFFSTMGFFLCTHHLHASIPQGLLLAYCSFHYWYSSWVNLSTLRILISTLRILTTTYMLMLSNSISKSDFFSQRQTQ